MKEEEKLKKALVKKAFGYEAKEVIEEFSVDDDGNERLSKKKVTKKHFSPDIAAMKLLFEKFPSDVKFKLSEMSDEELFQARHRILELILKEENDGN